MMIKKKLLKIHLIISIVFHLAIAAQVLFYLVPIKSDDTWVGWEQLSVKTLELKQQYPDAFIFSADGYKTSAALNFYLEEKVYSGNILGFNALHFDYLGDNLSTLNGKDALFIDSDKRFKNPNKQGEILTPEVNDYFDQVIELEPIIVKRGEKEIRKFWVFLCKNYQSKN